MSLLALRPHSLQQATLEVDLGAVTANVRTIKSRTAGELMAVVKADGFGHGQIDVARAALAGGATRFGVTGIDEARPLREAGLTQRVLSWLNPPGADFAAAVRLDIELGVPGLDHLHAIARTAPGARIHLQLDTGMGRDGAEPAQWDRLCRAAWQLRESVRVVGIMGHLPCADQPGHAANARGRDLFVWGLRVARAAGLSPADHHLAATAATLSDPLSHHTMSRIGAGLVGIDESGTVRLRPALTLTAPLVTIRSVPAGTSVGYGHTWTARRATRLGLIPVGYADGLPQLASGRAEVWVAGTRRPVAGRISMDMTVIDLGPDTPLSPGDPVIVFGPGDRGEPTTAEWATWAETLEHEIVTGLSARLRRKTTL
ncbi:alanine racemase [Allorhizocola rhizosphaerae]|uniref:alanine racemase n=1 Tax=Allorhizocola rhizosphaerae TaxID=1872709 RepID=UPI000E3BA063|nr:alanine racemase [Allorhizocola rhizosphaerae]